MIPLAVCPREKGPGPQVLHEPKQRQRPYHAKSLDRPDLDGAVQLAPAERIPPPHPLTETVHQQIHTLMPSLALALAWRP